MKVGIAGRIAHAFLDACPELARDGATNDLGSELDAGTGIGLDLQPDVTELAAPAGLLLVPALDLGLGVDRLAVGDARWAGHHGGAELALQPLDDNGHVRVALGP